MEIKSAESFVAEIATLQFKNVFNPYSDICAQFDECCAADIRRDNLLIALRAVMRLRCRGLWIARDLGYRGGRRTGLAMTDEAHLSSYSTLLKTDGLRRATRGDIVTERTATVIWDVISSIRQPVFLWNVFPLHPYEAGDEFSNRCHTRHERDQCRPFLEWLVKTLSPTHIVAIGRDAQNELEEIGIRATRVRHPSYGGNREFAAGIHELYGTNVGQA